MCHRIKKIIINATDHETRVCLLENDVPVEFFLEGHENKRCVGTVCKGRVTKVLPGMQSAFVDIGMDRDAFLYVMDIVDNLDDIEKSILFGEYEDTELEIEKSNRENDRVLERNQNQISITDLLREGQEIMVQVAKEPIGGKGARVTTHITLPGRYLVYMPTVHHIGISKRIEEEEERKRLKELIQKIRPAGTGFIVRTAGEGKLEEEFKTDFEALLKLWHNIQDISEKAKSPSIIHRDLDLVFKTVRDLFTDEVERLEIDNEIEYQRLVEYVHAIQPHLTQRVKFYLKSVPIFEEYGVEDEIEKALNRKVWLKSGGYIVIDQTEALVSIDVNTGKYVGKRNFEDTITRTNLEAAKEIMRQIRLRDLGGIIIIDFIDMQQEENKQKVLETLESEIRKDRSKVNILPLSELGLIQMTRKRMRPSLGRSLMRPCPYCHGSGLIKSKSTICHEIQREIHKMAPSLYEQEILLRVNPVIANYLRKEEDYIIYELESNYKTNISIKADESLHHEQFDIMIF
ncbi:ribonuclease E/G [candidate division CSSED10-310 bacterium]|uniref:Ribonuclease G n=1 Tax=candidate division CSSED10-310 bacterium TaxID=2855610 RepID=A0ABV6YW35_UNCC1